MGRPMEIVRLRAKGGAERGWELTGDGDRGVAGLYLGRGLAQEHRSGMGSALGCLGRRCRAGGMALDGEAALGAGNSPECGAWAPRARQGLRDLAHGIRGALGRLPRARIGPELQRSGVDVEVRRRRGTEFVARSQACSFGRLGPAGRRASTL